MSAANVPSDQSFQDELQKRWASQSIEMQFWEWPEFRLELINEQFLVGGTLAGSRWLLREALKGWGLEAAIAFAPVELWWEALRLAYRVSCQTTEEWWLWAESLPLASGDQGESGPLLGSHYIARQLREDHGVQGVGVIGALVRDEPLNVWSRIQLVMWDVPEGMKLWQVGQTLPEKPAIELISAVRALLGEWEEISQRMQVLEGEWQPCGPRPQERMVFHWKED